MAEPIKLLFILGTRPEAIKLAPLVIEFKKNPRYEIKVCVTAQHREMLDQVLVFFEIVPDFDLDIMKPGQTLFGVTADALKALEKVFAGYLPHLVFVQGDTTTSFVGALAAYYSKVKVAHVEAGLRSGNKYSPFPEELNRMLAGRLSDFHFTPTKQGEANLAKENIIQNVFVVGNTVIDALFLGLQLIEKRGTDKHGPAYALDTTKKIVLITGHRRESFGEPFENICSAISACAEKFPGVEFVYPVHLNPQVSEPVHALLGGRKNVHLLDPLGYADFIRLMSRSYVLLTDSGGLQEEAPALGKPVLVMRDVTERSEGIDSGNAKLVGTDRQTIIDELSLLLTDDAVYSRMATAANPYGDGNACKKIAGIVSTLQL
jgi:UDP-N-acetylglucosamine 2-epimerase (non-hydrolysing)